MIMPNMDGRLFCRIKTESTTTILNSSISTEPMFGGTGIVQEDMVRFGQ